MDGSTKQKINPEAFAFRDNMFMMILGIILFSAAVLMYANPNLIWSVAFVSALLIISISIVCVGISGRRTWKESGIREFVPLFIGLLFLCLALFAASPLAARIKDAYFIRNASGYSEIVAAFRCRNLNCAKTCRDSLEPVNGVDAPTGVSGIYGMRCSDGNVAVVFTLRNEARMLHEGYLYKDYSAGTDCDIEFGVRGKLNAKLPYIRHIERNWYRFSDQPGF